MNIQNSQKKKFVNPHLVYYEQLEGSGNDFDASVINRNILDKSNIQKELFSQPKLRVLNEISKTKDTIPIRNQNKLFTNIEKFSGFKGENKVKSSLNLSIGGGVKKISKESGFGY